MQFDVSRQSETLPRLSSARAPHPHPEHTLVITTFKRLIVALAFILPAAAMVSSPVMAASRTKPKSHHVVAHNTSVHKASMHKATHVKRV